MALFMKSKVIYTSFFLISLLSSLMLLELGLRALHIRPKIFNVRASYVKPSENPLLGYELDENDPVVNSLGLREPEIDIKPADGVYRIVAVGDSVTFGCCSLPLAQGYPSHLQKLISPPNSDAQTIEVLNAGVVGYNTVQEAVFIDEKISKLDPDFLILQVTLNDWMYRAFEYDELISQLPQQDQKSMFAFYDFNLLGYKVLKKSYVFQHVAYFQAMLKTKWGTNGQASQAANKLSEELEKPGWEQTEIIETGFQMLNQEVDSTLGRNVLIVLFPHFGDDWSEYPSTLIEEEKYIANLAEQNGFSFLNLRKCYEEDFNTHGLTLHNDSTHPNEYGHQVAARCIAEHMKANYGFSSPQVLPQ